MENNTLAALRKKHVATIKKCATPPEQRQGNILRLGNKKSEARYLMTAANDDGGDVTQQLAESDSEKDYGVVLDKKLTFKQHIEQCTSMANRIASIIRRSFDHFSEETFVLLLKSVVQPISEYDHAVGKPRHKNLSIEVKLEEVQRRATGLLDQTRIRRTSRG
ncbi:hypothetical protein ElyMa_005046500 [Elysia marginata]|uniref:Uncharacterized protein n=1 Tax=Elysia marginata TaxID=1093978 RepID=A0AAV4JDM4_9GAST|nr:hypothetical protein ElyMa_005046500 [Elysia marginata]